MANLHLNFRSDMLMRSVYPRVFLPDYNDWNDVPPPYRTLYFLHGYSGGALETATFTNFALYAAVHGIAIVMIDGDNSFYVDDEQRNACYSRYVGEEIVRVTRKLLPLSHRREDTFIAGISMGGYGALINGLRYSDTFSKIGMLSPALGMYPENGKMQPGSPLHRESMLALLGDPEHYHGSYRDYEAAMRKALEKPQDMPRLFLACGTEDLLVYQAGRDFAHRMQAEGAPMTYYEAQGGHDHVFWKHAMTPLCEFLTAKGGK